MSERSERTIAEVALAPGDGRVVRRRDAVLYLPAPDATLLAAFADADDGAELQALGSAAVARGFAVAGFVALSWRGAVVRVMVFGDVAVETDQPSLPMLTGAGSRTWVEHSLVLDDTAVITVGADDAILADTRLDAGVALAGGFRLRLEPATEPPAPDPEPAPPAVADTRAPDHEETSEPPPGVPTVERPEPTVPVPRPTPAPPTVDPTDPEAALMAIQAAAMTDEGVPLLADEAADVVPGPPPATDALPPPIDDPDVTLAPPQVETLRAELRADLHDGGASLVDARICSRHHPNPPSVAACEICGELLAPGPAGVVHVPQPVLGALVLDDGTRIELDGDFVLGRNPRLDDDAAHAEHRGIRVPGDKVSRRHLEVRRHGWDVIVADLGSTNGSFVVPHPGGPVLALEPGRPQLVEPGATVYFGSRSFTIAARGPGGRP